MPTPWAVGEKAIDSHERAAGNRYSNGRGRSILTFRTTPTMHGGIMADSLTRRDLLKVLAAAGCVAALPQAPALAGGGGQPAAVSGCLTGAQALVEALQLQGTEVVFGIPGAQDNELWDT